MSIASQWRDAIATMSITHLDRECEVDLRVEDSPPRLAISVIGAVDTLTGLRRDSLAISTVTLTYFPGRKLAQRWLAAAWAGYMQHEALELVKADGVRPLDPHGALEFDRGLRWGLPVTLTPTTLLNSLLAVMTPETASRLITEALGVDS